MKEQIEAEGFLLQASCDDLRDLQMHLRQILPSLYLPPWTDPGCPWC